MQEISLFVLDIAQNSVRAHASLIKINIGTDRMQNTLTVEISDNGCGMSEEQLSKVIDPFYTTRTTRKVGLGIPFFKMTAEMTGGSFDIQSELNVGTTTKAVFKTDSVDFIPLGDISASIVTLIGMNTSIDFIYTYRIDENIFTLDTVKIKEMLEGVPLSEPDIMLWLKDYITEQSDELLKS